MYQELPLIELQELLVERYDEISILEILDITSEELIDRFIDKIEDKQEELVEMLSLDYPEGYDNEYDW